MPRPEVEIDGSTPEGAFALGLRALRDEKRLNYQTMAKIAHFAPTTLSKAASGRGLPSLGVTLAYVRACGGSEQEWETSWHDLRATLGQRAVDESMPGTQEEGEGAESSPWVVRRAKRFGAWALKPSLVLVGALFGACASLVVGSDQVSSTSTVAPTTTVARSIQPFEIADKDGASMYLTVGETTRWVNLKNPNSTSLVVTELSAKFDVLSGDSAPAAPRCYSDFVEYRTVQKVPYSIDPHGTTQIVFMFEVLPDIPDSCKGRAVRLDYAGEAIQGTIIEGKPHAS